ncbi:hypothetical protein SADUNF_Sadunf06G0196000 [Salix dunnii]|uniref:Pentatricopeptide repeat-containing protein n=1 Tax=Salix dunnii TaxID=1413687 RepID=A0A835MY10_9ROSI|nr:hypothetical protein SADUNF_Sadunf06G0196000 [Salix dunnii]
MLVWTLLERPKLRLIALEYSWDRGGKGCYPEIMMPPNLRAAQIIYADGKDGDFYPTLLNHEPTTIAAGHGGSTVIPSSHEFETAAEASIASSAETSSEVESSSAKPTWSVSGTEQNIKPQRWISSFVTPNQITSAIAASEKSRLRCSVAVALLVVLSHYYFGFPLLSSNFVRSVIISRPLHLDLLTNVTPVLAPLLFNNHRGFKGAVEAEKKTLQLVELIGLDKQVMLWRGLFSVLNERQKFANFLRFCSKNLLLDQGMQVHGALVKMGFGFDLMLSNDLIVMYGKCGRLGVACDVFDRMLERNVVSWTALMCGYIQNGNPLESLLLFSKMASSGVKPNDFTFSTNLKACGLLNGLYIGRQVHDTCVKTGFDMVNVVGNSIIDMYSKCGRINEAASMFEVMPVRNLISWNAMIAGYTVAGFCKKALVLFRKMKEGEEFLDEFTFTSTLKACSDLGAIKEGNQIHAFLIIGGFLYSLNTAIVGALIDLYVKCGELFMARRVFSHIEEKHVISWTALILGYAQEGNLEESMDLFRQLRESSIRVDGFILSSMMGVFADFALVQQGKQMHAFAIKVPSGVDISVPFDREKISKEKWDFH